MINGGPMVLKKRQLRPVNACSQQNMPPQIIEKQRLTQQEAVLL